ncbi:MAG: TetR/AcrR family transcriptional regulator [Bacteroidota bacterium]
MDNINEKYKDIVNQGKDLFWKYGIKKVTVEEICAKAGTSRVTFYKYFDNKEQLAYYILKNLLDESIKEFEEIMNSAEPFETKVKQVIHFKIKNTGRISYEFLSDIQNADYPQIVRLINQTKVDTMKILEDHFREAQWNGFIRKDVKMEFILYFINKMQELVYDPQLEKLYPDTGALVSELIRFFFYGILPEKTE